MSDDLDPGVISARLGIEPDDARRRHSHTPRVPPRHIWIRRSRLAEALPLDHHIAALLDLMDEHRTSFREIAAFPSVTVDLMIVRNFENGDEDFDQASYGLPPRSDYERLGGQHPFLGLHLEPEHIALLAEVGAAFDVDEYG